MVETQKKDSESHLIPCSIICLEFESQEEILHRAHKKKFQFKHEEICDHSKFITGNFSLHFFLVII